MPPLAVKECIVPAISPSRWVHAIYLTCNDEIAVHFNHGQDLVWRRKGYPKEKGPVPNLLGTGGVPAVCCLYPRTAGAYGRELFQLAHVWTDAGEWVHRFLYKKQPYKIVQPPALPCAGCRVGLNVVSSTNPSCADAAVTFTASVSDLDGSAVPAGTFSWFVDNIQFLTGQQLDASGQGQFSISTLAPGMHTVVADFTPSDGFQANSASIQQSVVECTAGGGGGGAGGVVQDGCCNSLPTVVYLTLSNVTDQRDGSNVCWPASVSVPLSWDSSTSWWSGSLAPCDSSGTTTQLALRCQSGNPLTYSLQVGISSSGNATYWSLSASCASPAEIDFAVNGRTSENTELFVSTNYAAANAKVTT
jgi:hypothetical protein